jgi:hypothetical protein
VWAAFSDPEGYRPEQCYPYAYDGNGAAHYTETVDVIFTCAEAYAARTEMCTGSNNYKLQVQCDNPTPCFDARREDCSLWGRTHNGTTPVWQNRVFAGQSVAPLVSSRATVTPVPFERVEHRLSL